jgi:sirohydrochlorin ferrochelatase
MMFSLLEQFRMINHAVCSTLKLTFRAGYDRYSSLRNEGSQAVKTAVIILFHGSRAEGAGEIAGKIADKVGKQGNFEVVTIAFLQHAKPDLMQAVHTCIHQGAGKIIIVPFFLQMGTHVTSDIPVLMDLVKKRYPGLSIVATGAVGTHPMMADIVAKMAQDIQG